MKKKTAIALLFLVLAGGCATPRPALRMEKGASLAGYEFFEVSPVTNDTGKTYDFDVADKLTHDIGSKLKDKGYAIADGTQPPEGVVVIKSSLIAYEPGSAIKRWIISGYGKTQATVKTTLIDKGSGKVIGEMVTADAVSSGGLFSVGADKWILELIAKGIASEIDEKVKGE